MSRWPLMAAAAGAAVLALPVGIVLLLSAPASGSCGASSGAPTQLAQDSIPANLMPLYSAAEQRYGVPWSVLAAINKIETDFGRNLAVSTAGAVGWMQFMPATWALYGVDGNGDGRRDPEDPEDAIPAAARYSKASGAPGDLRAAIFAYNHADWYVADVLGWAHKFAANPTLGDPVATGACDPGGAVAGTPKYVIDTIVLPISGSCGVPKTAAEVEAANAAHSDLTASGNPSDHKGPPDQAWAADLGHGSPVPTPQMDCVAEKLAERFGIPWSGSGLVNHTAGGYRFQLIYRAEDHDDHVHFGVSVERPAEQARTRRPPTEVTR